MVIVQWWKLWSTMESIFGQSHRLQRGRSGNQMGQLGTIRHMFGQRLGIRHTKMARHDSKWGTPKSYWFIVSFPSSNSRKKQWSWLYSLCWDKYWLVACIICHVPCPYALRYWQLHLPWSVLAGPQLLNTCNTGIMKDLRDTLGRYSLIKLN